MTWRDVALAGAALVLVVALATAEGVVVAWKQAREAAAARLAPPELKRVPEVDQGIDFQHPTPGGLFPLIELSTGRQILDAGEPVYMDAGGMRAFPTSTPLAPR